MRTNARRLCPVALLCLVFACGPELEPVPQKTIVRVQGLWTNPNDVNAPEGALAVADDVSLARPGIAEPRRGMLAKGAAGGSINALTEFGGQLVAHVGSNTVKRSADDGATWIAYSGTYAPPDSSTPVVFTQQNGSLFMTTSAGEYELDSVTGSWRLTGAPRGLDGTATLQRTSATAGWASPDGQWAYRVLWGYRNGNNFIEFGAPSGRFLFSNPATFSGAPAQITKTAGLTVVTVDGVTHGLTTGEYIDVTLGGAETYFAAGTYQVTVVDFNTFSYSDGIAAPPGIPTNPNFAITYGMTRNVTLKIPIPQGITTDYFGQLYRSGKSASSTSEPSDILGQVAEFSPTNVDIANGYLIWNDVTPDILRGLALYTVDEGILAAKERPPLSKCKAVWRDSAFYCSTESAERMTIQLLSTAHLYTGANPTAVMWADEDVSLVATTATEDRLSFIVATGGTVAQNIADTARSIVRAINLGTYLHNISAYYLSGDADAPGIFMLERAAGSGQFDFVTWDGGGSDFAPNPTTYWSAASGGVARVSNVVTVTTVRAHDLVVGQQVTLESGTVDFPAGVKTIATVPTTTSFTYAEAGGDATSATPLYYRRSGPSALSNSQDRPNRVMWSVPGEPWAVPLINFQDISNPVGGPTPNIKAAVPIRDKVVVWTDAGTYQVTGSYPFFAVTELDVTVNIVAPRTAVAFSNYAAALTDQGLALASESIRVVSAPIDNTLKSLFANYRSNLGKRAFAVPYETERALLLWVVDDGTDAYSAQAFPFWLGAGEVFSRWTLQATAGFIRPSDGKLYIGTDGTLRQERKAYAAADHVDAAAISSAVEFLPLLPVGPGGEAEVDRGSFDFSETNFASATTQIATNLEPTFSAALAIPTPGGATPGARELVFPVPTSHQRGTRFRVRFAHSTASERYALQGVTLNFTKVSDQAGR